jgi:hypothetical protein
MKGHAAIPKIMCIAALHGDRISLNIRGLTAAPAASGKPTIHLQGSDMKRRPSCPKYCVFTKE